MTLIRPAKLAIGLWMLLAVVVFNVTYDWEVRAANHAFVHSQRVRQQQGQPPISINDGFRPVVRAAAAHSAVWLVLIAATGAAGVAVAGRRAT
jgi:hypothetical protein